MKRFIDEYFKTIIIVCVLTITIVVVVKVGTSYAASNATIYSRDELSEIVEDLKMNKSIEVYNYSVPISTINVAIPIPLSAVHNYSPEYYTVANNEITINKSGIYLIYSSISATIAAGKYASMACYRNDRGWYSVNAVNDGGTLGSTANSHSEVAYNEAGTKIKWALSASGTGSAFVLYYIVYLGEY